MTVDGAVPLLLPGPEQERDGTLRSSTSSSPHRDMSDVLATVTALEGVRADLLLVDGDTTTIKSLGTRAIWGAGTRLDT